MIDLHTHTNYSDGSSTLKELLMEAEKTNITTLSITDHNTVEVYFNLDKKTRDIFSGRIIPGVEITTYYNGEIIEVLGYGFDLNIMQKLLKEKVYSFYEKQLKEFELINKRYQEIGVKFDVNNIIFDPTKESCRIAFVKEIKRYPENNHFFLEESSLTSDSGFTRNEVYNPKSPLYVDESSLFPSLEETISMIHLAGGYAFLAHLYAYSKNIPPKLLDIINNYKLDGLECFYTIFTPEQSNYLVNVCRDYHLYMSGGSDYHGTRKINHDIGIGHGNLAINEDIINPWVNNDKPKIFTI